MVYFGKICQGQNNKYVFIFIMPYRNKKSAGVLHSVSKGVLHSVSASVLHNVSKGVLHGWCFRKCVA
jgi:hypothetical protein